MRRVVRNDCVCILHISSLERAGKALVTGCPDNIGAVLLAQLA